MAVQVHIKNFQALRDTGLEIKGFTAITGPNNSGKTALMRAIRGAFQNTPGTTFVRHGATDMEVSLSFSDGRSVVWKKGTAARSKPTYILDGGKPIHPGRSVPDEVRALGVVPIKVMGQDVWPTLAPQFTGQVFLLDQPGSSLAEAVADVDRVSKLNGALRSSDRDLRATVSRLKVRREDQDRLADELQAFDGLDAIAAVVDAIELDQGRATRLSRAIDRMNAYKGRLVQSRAEVARLGRIEDVNLPSATEAQALADELESLTRLQRRLSAWRDVATSLEGVEQVEVAELDTAKPTKACSMLEFLSKARVGLSAARQQVIDLESELLSFISEAERVATEVIEMVADFGECPTCGALAAGHGCGSP
jgi:DNA repair exonuclease SbcCD ATPase subunit